MSAPLPDPKTQVLWGEDVASSPEGLEGIEQIFSPSSSTNRYSAHPLVKVSYQKLKGFISLNSHNKP